MRSYLARRTQADEAEASARAARLRAAVPGLARLLVGFGARRVWLFGSLAWGHPDGAADIDLATEGLPADTYFGALAALLDAAPAPVDLVRLEDAPESLRARVESQGRRLADVA